MGRLKEDNPGYVLLRILSTGVFILAAVYFALIIVGLTSSPPSQADENLASLTVVVGSVP